MLQSLIICHCCFNINDQQTSTTRGRRPFRFENKWVKDEICQRNVVGSWKDGTINSFTELAGLVDRCGILLSKWNKKVFGNLQFKIKQKKLEIDRV